VFIAAIPLLLVFAGMAWNGIGLSFDQPPSSTEQDPAKRAAAEGDAYRRFFDLKRKQTMARQKRVGEYAWSLIVAFIGSFIWLYVYTVNKTTAATQIAALQTMAMEEGKDMVLSVALKAASSGSAFAAMYKAARQSYQSLAQGTIDPLLGRGGAASEMKAAQKTVRLERFLEIEKRTVT
jgi:hypothetical protein